MRKTLLTILLGIATQGFAVPTQPDDSLAYTPATSDHQTPLVSESRRLALIKVARAFLDAESPEQRIATIAPLEGSEQRLREWTQDNGKKASDWSQAEIGSRLMRKAPFTIMPVRGGGVPSSELVLIDTPDGPKIDWEAFVTYQQLPWGSLGEADWSGSVEIRAQVMPIPNHHPVLSEAAGYRCFALAHPSTGQRLFAYSKDGEGVARSVWKGYTQPMTLRVSQPDEMAGTLNVHVEQWTAIGWSRFKSE